MPVITLFFILLAVTGTYSSNPGFKTRITSRAIDYANGVAVDVLTKKLMEMPIPDIHGKESGVEYSVIGVKIKSFNKPSSKINIVPKTGLGWQLSNAGISLHGDFKYKYKKGWIKISDHGSIDAGAEGVGFSIAITIGQDTTGRPLIGSNHCSVAIGSMNLKFHGGASWIYNLFKDTFIKALKKLVVGKLCEVVSNAINNDAEKSLKKLKVTALLDKDFLLDYRLTAPPNFTSTYLETMHKGEIFWNQQIKEAPFSAAPLPPVPRSEKMIHLWVSDFLFNTAMFVAQKYNFLKFNLTANDLPASQRSVLDTSCVIMCVGAMIPKIRQKYPHTSVDLEMASSKKPHIDVQNGQLLIRFFGDIKMNALMKNQNPAYLLTLSSAMNMTVNMSIENEQIFGHLQDLKIDIGVKDSAIGNVNKQALQFLLDSAISIFVKPHINSLLKKGFPLPMTDDIKFRNTELLLLSDALVVSTDVVYNATATPTNGTDGIKIFPNIFQEIRRGPSYKIQTL
ncbi:hypothetical protein ScPMuIL_000121 [Solemya velum]